MIGRRTPADLARIDRWLDRLYKEAPIQFWMSCAALAAIWFAFTEWLVKR